MKKQLYIANFLFFFLYINIFTLKNKTPMSNRYEIITLEKIKSILLENDRYLEDMDEIIETNQAYIFYLKEDTIIVYRNGTQRGLLLNDRAFLKTLIQNEYYYIEDEYGQSYEYEVDKFKNINKNIPYFLSFINSVMQKQYTGINKENLEEILTFFYIKKKKNNFTRYEWNALIAVVGEYSRKELDGKWLLKKGVGEYNSYYEPLFMDKNGKIKGIVSQIVHFMDNEEIRFDYFYNSLFNMAFAADIYTAKSRGINYIVLE